jgi:dolichyl-phosphate beta-glucosyltransferase
MPVADVCRVCLVALTFAHSYYLSQMPLSPLVSIIIPSFNDSSSLQKQLPGLISWLEGNDWRFELIIVDDGSDDAGATAAAAKELGCIYLRNAQNSGKGATVRAGMLHAKGDFCVFTDADIPFEYDTFGSLIKMLQNGSCQMVMGDRTLPGSVYFRKITRRRKLTSLLFSFLVGKVLLQGHMDTQCGLKGFRKEAARLVFSLSRIRGFASDVEWVVIAKANGITIGHIPVRLRSQEGASVHVFRHASAMILDLIRIGWNRRAGKYRSCQDALENLRR